jgi:hypothetical protein
MRKLKAAKSPFDGDLIYWSTRLGEHPEMDATEQTTESNRAVNVPIVALTLWMEICWKKTTPLKILRVWEVKTPSINSNYSIAIATTRKLQ